ncbi:hypothetical protein L7F22_004480 [Adiantum nelumboides]|nr:hypothetical protein [Adiantum nelumboides]
MSLSYNKLTGGIPRQVGNSSSLNYVMLDGNSLGGVIPESIRDLKLLSEFHDADGNLLIELIHATLSNSTLLVNIDVSHNSLRGPLMDLGCLTKLGLLNALVNQLSGSIPASIANCTTLELF